MDLGSPSQARASTSRLGREQEIRVLETLGRLLDSGALGQGERLPAMLRYVVSEELAGRGDRIKSFSIATEVLGRRQDFDPQSDGIARAEMTRLRRALEQYFTGPGASEPVRIIIPKGTYRPAFSFPVEGAIATVSKAGRGWTLRGLALAAVLAAAGLGFLIGERMGGGHSAEPAQGTASTGLPLLVVQPASPANAIGEELPLKRGLQAELVARLIGQRWLTVVLPPIEADTADTLMRQPRQRPIYLLDLRLTQSGDEPRIWAALTRARSGELVWSRQYDGPSLRRQSAATVTDIAGAIASDLRVLGDMPVTTGAIAEASGDRTDAQFLCLMQAREYWQSFSADTREHARSCLTREVADDGGFLEGRAALALLLVEQARMLAGPERAGILTRAGALVLVAERPERLTLEAQLALAACRGDRGGVKQAADTLLDAYANDPDILGDAGSKLGLVAGEWERALALEAAAGRLTPFPKPWYPLSSVTKALLDGQPAQALSLIDAVPQRGFATGHALRLAIAGQLGDRPLAQSSRARLAHLGILDAASALALIEGECWAEPVKAVVRQRVSEGWALN